MDDLLKWDVFVTPGIPIVTSDPPPGAKQRLWSPISSTLDRVNPVALWISARAVKP